MSKGSVLPILFFSGKTIVEYSTAISDSPQVAYLTSDALGTPRINTSAGGAVLARHDYHPFGEEISTSERTPESGYDSDQIRKKFTGYERDDETGLDYAQARMYCNKLARFMSTDPIIIEKKRLADPQAFNLFSYVRNNPLVYLDKDGKSYVGDDGKNVEMKFNKKTKTVQILSNNATKDLQRIVDAANKAKTQKAFDMLKQGFDATTKVTFRIYNGPLDGQAGKFIPLDKNGNELQSSDNGQAQIKWNGDPAFVADKETGKLVFEAVVIQLNDTMFNNIPSRDMQGMRYGLGIDDGMLPTSDESMIAVVIHELFHGTDKTAAIAYRDNNKGWINNFPHHGGATDQNEAQYFRELKEIKEQKQ